MKPSEITEAMSPSFKNPDHAVIVIPSSVTGYKVGDYTKLRRDDESEVCNSVRLEHDAHVATIRNVTTGVCLIWCLTCDAEVLIIT
jgi:hypothetical protein